MQTLCKGAQVCQAWLAASEGLGPRQMDFSTDNFVDECGSCYLKNVLNLIDSQADDTLECLTIGTAHILVDGVEAMQDICNVLHAQSFPVLTTLHIGFSGDLRHWQICFQLPVTLKSLYLGLPFTKNEYCVKECFDLEGFNHLASLEELSLLLDGRCYEEVIEVSGDLVLPALHSCHFARPGFEFRVAEAYDICLVEFTASGLAESCLIRLDQGVSCQVCDDRYFKA